MNNNAYIARKIIASISALIKKMSSSKNVTFARKFTKYSILNVLKDKERK